MQTDAFFYGTDSCLQKNLYIQLLPFKSKYNADFIKKNHFISKNQSFIIFVLVRVRYKKLAEPIATNWNQGT